MTDKRQTLDVWIVETKTVYKEVPFAVVADWLQQGRLLADDRVRPAGGGPWAAISATPPLARYLPRPEPFRAEDQAEALERVAVDFTWKPRDDDEEDVDMIPLIDISLVLLIFFMMTATVGLAGLAIDTPPAEFSWLNNDPTMLAVGIDLLADGSPAYQLGEGDRPITDPNLTEAELWQRLDEQLRQAPGYVDVRITAHRDVKYSVVQAMTVKLESRKPRVRKVYAEVSDKGT
jgi:biopolymer transport protein ExbD